MGSGQKENTDRKTARGIEWDTKRAGELIESVYMGSWLKKKTDQSQADCLSLPAALCMDDVWKSSLLIPPPTQGHAVPF